MYYLVYVSSALREMSNDELVALLAQSREKNQRLGITGMLLYKSGNFLQLLEGPKDAVRELYARIARDERHKDVILLDEGDCSSRHFGHWSMGFRNMDDIPELPSYDEVVKTNLDLLSYKDDGKAAYELLRMFEEGNR